MANPKAPNVSAALPGNAQALWLANTNTVLPAVNDNFLLDKDQRPRAGMDQSHVQGFTPRNGHCRTRSTITIPRSSWFDESSIPSPVTRQGHVLSVSAYANDLPAGQSYCLDRGNGEFTRLIPADLLPALNEIPARETRPHGMVILPALGPQSLHPSLTVKKECVAFQKPPKQVDSVASTGPSNRRSKVYCDKWVHEGVCAFTQQGCKFKHEMPFDEPTQRSLGLFQGFPAWWKKRNEEAEVDTSRQISILSRRQVEFSPANETPALEPVDAIYHVPQRPISQGVLCGGDRAAARSQWIRNGIVPFFQGPGTGLPQAPCSTSDSQRRCARIQGEFREPDI